MIPHDADNEVSIIDNLYEQEGRKLSMFEYDQMIIIIITFIINNIVVILIIKQIFYVIKINF